MTLSLPFPLADIVVAETATNDICKYLQNCFHKVLDEDAAITRAASSKPTGLGWCYHGNRGLKQQQRQQQQRQKQQQLQKKQILENKNSKINNKGPTAVRKPLSKTGSS